MRNKQNEYSKKKKCKICKIAITNASTYCRRCSNKCLRHYFTTGIYCKPNYCIDCGRLISPYAHRCKKHSNILKTIQGKIGHHGNHIKYKDSNMKSTWEFVYAKYLDRNNVEWKYELKTFDLGTTTYTPDFYLPETDEYIEIKGIWYKDARIKFNLFKKQYFNIKIKLLRRKDLKKLKII